MKENLTKTEAIEMIEELKTYIQSLTKEEKTRYATADRCTLNRHFLKINEEMVVSSWELLKDLNDFDYFNRTNTGHFWINGHICQFEIIDDFGSVIVPRCNKQLKVRFLK